MAGTHAQLPGSQRCEPDRFDYMTALHTSSVIGNTDQGQ
jgi:hypothetical protein